MLDMDSPPEELKRAGNEHRQFIPVNAYPTKDGFIYIAIGSDAQWARFVSEPMFRGLAEERYRGNEGRRAGKEALHAAMGAITALHDASAVAGVLRQAAIPHSRITPIEEVNDLPFVAESALSTEAPDGRTIRLPPPAVPTPYLESVKGVLPFAPAYGEQTDALLTEIGLTPERTAQLREEGVVA